MYTHRVFGTAKCVLFIEVSLFQGVLNKGFHCIRIYLGLLVYVHIHKQLQSDGEREIERKRPAQRTGLQCQCSRVGWRNRGLVDRRERGR